MSRRLRLGAGLLARSLTLLIGVSLVCGAAAGEPGAGEALIRAHLESGEFAPAVMAAREIKLPDRRDHWLGQIAVAQAQAGARDASLRTASEIYGDRARSGTLAQISHQPLGGRGGAAMADFDSLIELITTTVQPDTWEDVGGPGSVAPFPTGVFIDPEGVLRPLMKADDTGRLAMLRAQSAAKSRWENARRASPLRKVSLTRLEKQVQLRLAAGRPLSEAMQVLAGLERIRYVFVYPDSRDVVLAGPAGNWQADAEDRIVGTNTGRPVLRLDDLIVVLRHLAAGRDAQFGCLITPSQDGLARLHALLQQPSPTFTRSGQRKEWLGQMQSALGTQGVEVFGLDPRTRAARVMVEADYRMKLVGMGLEEGVPGVKSYLDLIKVRPGESPPPMGVLRWWFTLNYDALLATDDRQAFALRGQGVKVLSENELLTAQGQRVHTGMAEPLNRQFAQSFTEHFEALAGKYPIYAELRNLCDVALVAALIRQEGLAAKVDWHMTCFGHGGEYRVEQGAAPKTVETVANHRVLRSGRQIHTLAGVSGGVRIAPVSLVSYEAIETERYGELGNHRSAAIPQQLPRDAWWWD
ncbi:MAG: DUF1598 domain-containing protein [Planctomycetota bacterium]|jgi:hypothetical protein